MNRFCAECQLSYDDARCSTICPHEAFITAAEALRKDRAGAMLHKDLRWQGSKTGTVVRIQSVTSQGFVTLAGYPAHHLYNPNLFEVIEP
jgi:hypothetical protein